jgi:hypothetical protein
MTVQIRPTGGGTPYAPVRDVAHCWQGIVKEVAVRLENAPHPFIREMLQQEHTSMADLAKACEAFCLFCATACTNPDENMSQALQRSGWFSVQPAAQVAYMAFLGQATAGVFFCGIRDATLLNEDIAPSIRQLRTYARRSSLLLSMSLWRRTWYRLTRAWQRRLRRRARRKETHENAAQFHQETSGR